MSNTEHATNITKFIHTLGSSNVGLGNPHNPFSLLNSITAKFTNIRPSNFLKLKTHFSYVLKNPSIL